MFSYCLQCRKNIKSKNPDVVRTKNGMTTLLSKCALCDSKKSNFIKEQEASGLLNSLGIKKDTFKKKSFIRPSFAVRVFKLIQGIK